MTAKFAFIERIMSFDVIYSKNIFGSRKTSQRFEALKLFNKYWLSRHDQGKIKRFRRWMPGGLGKAQNINGKRSWWVEKCSPRYSWGFFFKLPFKIYIENYSTSMFLVFQNYYIFSYILYRMTSGRSTYLHIEAAQILIKKHFKSIRYNNMTLTTWIIKLTSLGSLEIWTLVRLVTQQVGQPKKKNGTVVSQPALAQVI